MSEIIDIPHSARIDCAACGEAYDFRVMDDRSCPHCGCPPPTHRVEMVRDGQASGSIQPNPAHAAFLKRNETPDETKRNSGDETKRNDDAAIGRPRQHADAAARLRAWREKQRKLRDEK